MKRNNQSKDVSLQRLLYSIYYNIIESKREEMDNYIILDKGIFNDMLRCLKIISLQNKLNNIMYSNIKNAD